ncbi:MAG: ABC transporter permease [Bifidobacteriaceae bacterium]|jgi:putative ABC transport system permease protein|nr:ABC transporter permease [Bifidobacteriaceae bacterium]
MAGEAPAAHRSALAAPRSGIRVADLLREGVASVAARPGRSILTMTGTVLGCAAFLAIIGLTSTASGQITAQFNELEATSVTVVDTGVSERGEPRYNFPEQVGPLMRGLNGVVDAGVYASLNVSETIAIRPQVDAEASAGSSLAVYGGEPGTLAAAGVELVSGNGMDEFHIQTRQPVAVLGFAAAAQLGIASVVSQPTVFIGNRPYQVVGILGQGGSLPELGNAVIVPIGLGLERYGPPSPATPAHVLVRTDLGAAGLIARQAAYRLRPDAPDLLDSIAPPDWSMITDDVDTSVGTLLLALAGIALVIGCVAIANTTLVAVMERTGEIGLRQALGAKRSHILAQFLVESVLLGAIGGLLGSALGIAAVLIGSVSRSWTPVLEPALPLAAPVVGIVVGALAGLYPSWQASRIPPAAALQRV